MCFDVFSFEVPRQFFFSTASANSPFLFWIGTPLFFGQGAVASLCCGFFFFPSRGRPFISRYLENQRQRLGVCAPFFCGQLAFFAFSQFSRGTLQPETVLPPFCSSFLGRFWARVSLFSPFSVGPANGGVVLFRKLLFRLSGYNVPPLFSTVS